MTLPEFKPAAIGSAALLVVSCANAPQVQRPLGDPRGPHVQIVDTPRRDSQGRIAEILAEEGLEVDGPDLGQLFQEDLNAQGQLRDLYALLLNKINASKEGPGTTPAKVGPGVDPSGHLDLRLAKNMPDAGATDAGAESPEAKKQRLKTVLRKFYTLPPEIDPEIRKRCGEKQQALSAAIFKEVNALNRELIQASDLEVLGCMRELDPKNVEKMQSVADCMAELFARYCMVDQVIDVYTRAIASREKILTCAAKEKAAGGQKKKE